LRRREREKRRGGKDPGKPHEAASSTSYPFFADVSECPAKKGRREEGKKKKTQGQRFVFLLFPGCCSEGEERRGRERRGRGKKRRKCEAKYFLLLASARKKRKEGGGNNGAKFQLVLPGEGEQ